MSVPKGRTEKMMVDAAPFRLWLYGYGIRRRLWVDAFGDSPKTDPLRGGRMMIRAGLIADDLWLPHKSIQRVLFGAQERISIDIADSAIVRSDVVLTVLGVDVWSVVDLYEFDFELLADRVA